MNRSSILWTCGEGRKHYGLLKGSVVTTIDADALHYEFLGKRTMVLKLSHPELKRDEAFMRQLEYARENALAAVDSFCGSWVAHRLS